MPPIGSLVVRIGADVAALVSGGKEGEAAVAGLGARAATVAGSLAALAAGAAAAGAAIVGKLTKDGLEAVDSQAKLARQLGSSIDALKALQIAAADAGVDQEALTAGMEKFNAKLGEAQRGAGTAGEVLHRLGLTARELAEMDVDERMATVADAIQENGYSAQQTADALRQLGLKQGELVDLMRSGGDAIRAARQEVDDYGLSLSEVDAAKVEQANDAMERIGRVVEGVAQRFAVELAPIIKAVADRIGLAAKESGGFRSQVGSAIDVAVTGIGILADIAGKLLIPFKAVELAVWGVATAASQAMLFAGQVITTLVDGITSQINRVTQGINEALRRDVFGVIESTSDSEFMLGLEERANAVLETTKDIAGQLGELAFGEWPSDKLRKMFAEVRAEAEASAQAVAGVKRQLTGADIETEDDKRADEKRAREEEAERLSFERRLEALREYSMTATELENAQYAQRVADLNAALNQELVTVEQFAGIRMGLERKHQDALNNIKRQGAERGREFTVDSALAGVQQLTGLAESLTSSVSQNSREQFDIHKGFAIADALISGAAGVAQTLGAYPYPYNLAMAVPHAAMAAAQVAVIASQQYQGGGTVRTPSAPSMGGGGGGGGGARSPGPAAAGGPGGTAGPGQAAIINLHGDSFSRASVIGLIDAINDAVADGARIKVAS